MTQENEPSPVGDAIKTIQENHRKIIDDWCKAYLAKEYESGNDIHPGSFTLIQQTLAGPTKFGYKYTLEPNTEWKPIETAPKEGERVYLADANSKCRSGYYDNGKWYCSSGYYFEPQPVLWCELPNPPCRNHYCKLNGMVVILIKNQLTLFPPDDYLKHHPVLVNYCPICGEGNEDG